VAERRRDRIVADVSLPAPAWVIFSEFWFFPWEATVDGRPVPLKRVYHVLQGAKVAAGSHRVAFVFNRRHVAFVLPFALSSATLVGLGVASLLWFRRRNRKP
jgi:hypothetical protein